MRVGERHRLKWETPLEQETNPSATDRQIAPVPLNLLHTDCLLSIKERSELANMNVGEVQEKLTNNSHTSCNLLKMGTNTLIQYRNGYTQCHHSHGG